MKTKKFEKKLVLNKKTIANLGNNELGNALGGGIPDPTGYTCLVETCPTDCGTCYTCPTECNGCSDPPILCNTV